MLGCELARICNPCLSTPSFATTFAKQEMEKNVIIILYFGGYFNCYYLRQILNIEKAYFVTLTVVGWIDVFTRKNHKLTIIDSLKYCQQNKGLVIFGWCLMPSNLHMIVRAEGKNTLSDILKDFKKFTSKPL